MLMSLKTLSNTNYSEIIEKEKKLIIIDFWAEWCGPCKMLSPILESINEKYKDNLIVYKLNTDENPELAQDYKITSIPCCVFMKNGSEIHRVIGHKSEDAFESELKQFI